VESTWTGPKERAVKIFLRDGNFRELTSDSIPNLRSLTSVQFLELIGIKTLPPARSGGETRVKGRQ